MDGRLVGQFLNYYNNNNNIVFYSANIQFDEKLFSALYKITCVQEHAH